MGGYDCAAFLREHPRNEEVLSPSWVHVFRIYCFDILGGLLKNPTWLPMTHWVNASMPTERLRPLCFAALEEEWTALMRDYGCNCPLGRLNKSPKRPSAQETVAAEDFLSQIPEFAADLALFTRFCATSANGTRRQP